MHAAILQDANAPAWEGLPIAEDPELAAAKKAEWDDIERTLYNLPLKRKAKVR
jgi:hypothetical protein